MKAGQVADLPRFLWPMDLFDLFILGNNVGFAYPPLYAASASTSSRTCRRASLSARRPALVIR